MEQIISPIALYSVCVLGGLGVALALPRRDQRLQILGGIIFAAALGVAALALGLKASEAGGLPNFFFYPFAIVGLGASVRMVTHPRPVYSALYFILTIIASCGMYLLLSAEFMAFALVIIYAGAILITYLFVIMLAMQAPTSTKEELLDETDAVAREPVLAAALAFILLGLLTTAMFRGIGEVHPAGDPRTAQNSVLQYLPAKVDKILRRADMIDEDERVLRLADGTASVDAATGAITIENTDLHTTRLITADEWPENLGASNLDRLGFNLMHDHPMTIEIAGIILLMAMLGATVLARKHTEFEDDLKASHARRLGLDGSVNTNAGGQR
ncbi:MAG: NADH-quinone oxidoreductase subunit J [Phycisphaerales bacterium]|nr:NADH-quinone oxidoreductase subunit J [Phycisphaerales bacterium]